MSRFSHTLNSRKLFASAIAFVFTLGISLGAIPAAHAQALAPSSATVSLSSGVTFYNTSFIGGTASDADGVKSVAVTFERADTSAPISGPIPVTVNESGTWILQLNKNLIPIDLTSRNIVIAVRVVDDLDTVTDFSFGPYVYSVPDAEIFHAVVETLSGLDPASCAVAEVLATTNPITVFGPNNGAFSALPAEELAALLDAPDELCALVATHILPVAVPSSAVTDPVQVQPLNNSNDPLTVAPSTDATTVVVNDATVTNADNAVYLNSVLHVIDSIIRPQSTNVDIDDVYTNITSPELTGRVASEDATVQVRINGVAYTATNKGDGTWVVPAGVVQLDPAKLDTIFTVVARSLAVDTESVGELLGLTIRNDVLHYVTPGSGAGTVDKSAATGTTPVLLAAVAQISEQTNAQSAPATSQESTTKTEDAKVKETTPDETKNEPEENTAKTSTSQWYWWLIGIATLGALYYVLGGSSTENK